MIGTDARDRFVARRVLLAGLALGVLSELAFHGSAVGIGVPIVVVAVLLAGWSVRRGGRAPDRLDAWLPIGAVVLSTLVAIRADPFLAVLDLIAAAALVGASLAAMSGLAVTRRSGSAIAMIAMWGIGSIVVGIVPAILAARPERERIPRSMPTWVAPAARGLIIGLPLGLIFAVLFASADPIFRRAIDDVLGVRLDLGDLPGRAVFVLAAAWFLAGLVSIAAAGMPAVGAASLGAAVRSSPLTLGRSLGVAEALVILVVIDFVIAGFVGLQIAYLFGGQDTLEAAGIPYAQYARRGFFELVTAACLASAVIFVLESTIGARTRPYLLAVAALIALTGIVLVSAALRLDLYQQAYGWTELRLYVVAAIAAMAVGLAVMLTLVLVGKSRWLAHGLALVGLVALVGLNLIAPAAFVAARNVERVVDPSLVPFDGHSGLDATYLAVLPDDAIPVLVEALPRLPDPEADAVQAILLARRLELELDAPRRSALSWNLGRERALAALATVPDRRGP
jgi:hypothetical protein